MPEEPLRGAATEHLAAVTARAAQHDIPIAAVRDTLWDITLEAIAKEFEVSVDVVQKRVDKDGLRDELLRG